ncbi:MAG: phage Gp37/Gp68 family protein [Ferruginibacter sp.]|nr:phage Gp37/Gp68 family protein [Cytophagales bacterium]
MPTILLSTTDNGVIEWKTTSWNPTTGCDRISAGCDNCYALLFARRLKELGQPKYQRDGDPRTSGPGFDLTLHPGALDLPRSWRRPRHIFVGSMSDLFHARVPLDYVQQVVEVMRSTPQHTYQVLTKRTRRLATLSAQINWPDNVWVGTSIEDARQLHRADDLRRVDATVRFLSLEPLLGPLPNLNLDGIDWVSIAGESGPNARPIDADWVRNLRDCALQSGVPFFFLQWGGTTPKGGGRFLDGRTWDEMPVRRERARV